MIISQDSSLRLAGLPRGGASQSRSSSLLSGNLGYHHRDDDGGDDGDDDGGDPHDGDGQDLDPLLLRELKQRPPKPRATTSKRKQRLNR